MNGPVQILLDLIGKCCKRDRLNAEVKQTFNRCSAFGKVPVSLGTMSPKFEADLSIREDIAKPQGSPDTPTASMVNERLAKINYRVGRLTPSSHGAQELLMLFVMRISKALYSECRAKEEWWTRVHRYADLAVLLSEPVLDGHHEQHFERIFKPANKINPQWYTKLKLIKNCTLLYCPGSNDTTEPVHDQDCTCNVMKRAS